MKTRTHILMAALLTCPSLIAPAYAEEDQGGSADIAVRIFELEKESWDLFDVCFSHYVKMGEGKISQNEGIDAIYYASGRLARVHEEILDISQAGDRAKLARYEKVVSSKKYRERVKRRDHLTKIIVADAKKKGYANSKKLKKAMENLLFAIQSY